MPHHPKPPLWLLALAVSLGSIAMTIISPAIPLIQAQMQISYADAQMVLGIYLFVLAIAQLFNGSLSERFGRLPILLCGIVIFCLGSLFSFWAESLTLLLGARAIQALGGAACIVMGRVMISDAFTRQQAARNSALVTAMMVIVPGSGLAFGGIIAQYLDWRMAMLFLALFGAVTFIISLLLLKETLLEKHDTLRIIHALQGYWELCRNRIFMSFTLIGMLQSAIFLAMTGFMPYQFAALGSTPVEFGLWFALSPLGYLFGNLTSAYLGKYFSLEQIVGWGCVLSLCSVLLLGVGFYLIATPIGLALTSAFFGYANGTINAFSFIGRVSHLRRHRGSATGLVGCMQMLCGSISGSAIIYFGGAENFLIGYIAFIIMALGCIICLFFIHDK